MNPETNLAWNVESTGIQPGSLKTISDTKLVSFAVGQQKKSRFQKQREEKELKRKEEEKEAAKIYESFVASFADDDNEKTFVRSGGSSGSGDYYRSKDQRTSTSTSNSRSSLSFVPPVDPKPVGMTVDHIAKSIPMKAESKEKATDKAGNKKLAFFTTDADLLEEATEEVAPTNTRSNNKLKQLDVLLNEIKSKQDKRDSKDGPFDEMEMYYDGPTANKGSFDDGDPTTTNIFISYLAPTVTEEQLFDLFAKYGPVNSIKVMWPRSEEERLRKRNCGFVSFMKRSHAEDALMFLQGYELDGYALVLCWGKKVKISNAPVTKQSLVSRSGSINGPDHFANTVPSIEQVKAVNPFPLPAESKVQVATKDATKDSSIPAAPMPADPFANSSSRSKWDQTPQAAAAAAFPGSVPIPFAHGVYPFPPTSSSLAPPEAAQPSGFYPGAPSCMITFPTDPKVKKAIDLLARYVAIDGDQFEKVIRSREEGNPMFRFLEFPDTVEGWYYRWKTYSLMNGDSGNSWRGEPFQLSIGGMYIIPPPPPPPSMPVDSDEEEPEPQSRRRRRSNSPNSDEGDENESSRNDLQGQETKRRKRGRSNDDRSKYNGMTGAQIERMKMLEKRGITSIDSDKQQLDQNAEYLTLVRGGDTLLSTKSLSEWTERLKSLTMSRQDIKAAMGFAYDHIDSCEEVISLFREAFIDKSSSPPHQMALLFLLSDLLHNSSVAVKRSSNYRTLIQYILPEIFHTLGCMYRSIIGRITAQQIESRVRNVLNVWNDWCVFPPLFVVGLEASFMMTESEHTQLNRLIEELKSKYQTPSNDADKDDPHIENHEHSMDQSHSNQLNIEDIDTLRKKAKNFGVFYRRDGAPSTCEIHAKIQYVEAYAKSKLTGSLVFPVLTDSLTVLSNASTRNAFEGKDLVAASGVPSTNHDEGTIQHAAGLSSMDDDIDGVPMDDIDGEPMDDIDGEPIDDIDGVPMDDDIDGEPF